MKKQILFLLCSISLVSALSANPTEIPQPDLDVPSLLRLQPVITPSLAPGGPHITEIRREFYLDAAKTQWCGSTIRTCQGYFLKEGCCEELLYPTPYYDTFIEDCF